MTVDQIKNWALKHSYLMLVLIVLALFTERLELLSLGALLSFSSFIHRGSKDFIKMKPPGGYANWITGIRLMLIVIGSFLFAFITKEAILLIMGASVILDFADGFLARKFSQETLLGHYFDVEVDSFFVLIMCFYYFQFEGVGWWILIPGILRYLYLAVTSGIEKPDFKAKKRKYTSIIAGIFFIILLVCLISPIQYITPFLLFGTTLIVVSFGLSFIEYLRFKS